MIDSLKYNLANLGNFHGRQTRGRFWPYAITVVLLAMVGMMGVMLPMMVKMIADMQRFAVEHPDQVTVTQGPGHYEMQVHGSHPELVPDLSGLLPVIAAIDLFLVVLLAAAVTRRLHDVNRRGFWGAIPAFLLFTGMLLMGQIFRDFGAGADQPNLALFFLGFTNNMAYIVTLILLIVFTVGEGTRGDNRFGPPPAE